MSERRYDAEILLPMYYTPDGFFEHSSQYSSVQRSGDGGETWRDSAPMRGTLGKLVGTSPGSGSGSDVCFPGFLVWDCEVAHL